MRFIPSLIYNAKKVTLSFYIKISHLLKKIKTNQFQFVCFNITKGYC